MNRFLLWLIVPIFLLAASCNKEKQKQEIEEKLVGTWLLKTSGRDVNGNKVYDTEERTPHDSLTSRVTLTFKTDGSFLQINQFYSPGETKQYPGKWEVQKNNPAKMYLRYDDGLNIEVTIGVLTGTEFMMEHTPGFWNGYVRQ